MGKLIVLEGTDGSGKTTQLSLLCEHFSHLQMPFHKLEYPCYGAPGASLVEFYLNGGLGHDPSQVNPYAASSFFAADRYIDYHNNWKQLYEAGSLFLAGRYTTSNAVHQASKLAGEERTAFLNWLFHYEYVLLKLPKPDLVLFLDMPPAFSFHNLYSRQGADGDIHELDHAYLRHCYENACDVAAQYGWQTIACQKNGCIRTPTDIHNEIVSIVSNLF